MFGRVEQGGQEYRVGVTRTKNGVRRIRVDGAETRRTSILAGILPLQMLTPLTIELVGGSPVYRRRFLNWGLFHVEHEFASVWSRFNHCLRQRNFLLRYGSACRNDLRVWDQHLAETGSRIDSMRQAYISSVIEAVAKCKAIFNLSEDLELRYQSGWRANESLYEALDRTRDLDLRRGFTSVGPQRADLHIRWQGGLASEVASRGEMKALSWAMKLGQGKHMETQSAANCTYLVDDLGAELDVVRQEAVLAWLKEEVDQAIVTMTERHSAIGVDAFMGRFHVEQGSFNKEASS